MVRRTYNPDVDISTTYLWATDKGKQEAEKSGKSWFPKGSIALQLHGQVTGQLLDGTKLNIKSSRMQEGTSVKTLADSGASKSMLNRNFYLKNKFLHQYPIYQIRPRYIKVANDEVLTVNECIHMLVQFGEHVFEMITYLTDMLKDYDMIIGQKTMYELEGGPNFGSLTFDFMMRSVDLKSKRRVVIEPGDQKQIYLQLEDCPEDLTDAPEVIVKIKSVESGQLPQTLQCKMKNKQIVITAHNHTDRKWIFQKEELMGCVDMRSLGYFHIPRQALQTAMIDKCRFMSDDETVEYFNHLVEDTRELNREINTRIKHRMKEKNDEKDTNIVINKEQDPYPWLEPDDPRRKMTDEEILRKFVTLEEAHITPKQKEEFYKMALRYKEAFSLRDEIGLCPNMEVELELTDKTPFFIRPFPIKETDKDLVNKEMRKGVLLGILEKGMSAYSSPIMLIPRKLTGIPRIVTDFRHLNSRLVTINPSIPLVRDAIQIIGASGCEILSVVDLRDAYHTLRLSKNSQKFCGITPYYGSDSYFYKRLGMGLSVSPAIWQSFINKVLDEIPDRKHHLAIMDDCLVHSKEKDHMKHLEALFKALKSNGLKISPKKCQLFRKELVYMGHKMMIREGLPCITPLKSRIDAVIKLGQLKTPKNCKQFCGMVNFLSMFLKDLQKDLIPIYELTKKGMPWHWGEEQQNAYDTIKRKITSAPVLMMPNTTGHFVLASDTSKEACGGALWQFQKGKYRLCGYYSKKLPEACTRYSISELELTGMTCNISAFRHCLRNANFTVFVDHSALVHIIKAKKEPPTLRLQKLIEKLSEYCFNLKYMKGKSMYISDFLSRHPAEDNTPLNEIIPISFCVKDIEEAEDITCVLQEIKDCSTDMLLVTTRSQAKEQNITVPPIYPLVGTTAKPEQVPQVEQPQINVENEPQGNGEEVTNQLPDFRQFIPEQEIRQELNKQLNRPQEKQKKQKKLKKIESILEPIPIDVQLKGQLPSYETGKEFEFPNLMPTEAEVQKRCSKLFDFIQTEEIMTKHIPKQKELDKFLEDMKYKVIHDYKIPLLIKEIRAAYSSSPYFKDIYKYIEKGYNRYVGKAQRLFKMQCEEYVTIKGVLFKIRYDPNDEGKPSFVLCVPEQYLVTILSQYHDNILAGHPGATNLYETVRKLYFFPGMYNICRQFVISCFECQSRRDKEKGVGTHFPRIPLDYKPMQRLSLDLKTMPYSNMGFKHILLCTCEITNFVVGIPLPNERTETIANALFNRIICVFGTPQSIICDKGSSLTSELMRMYLHALNIKQFYVSPFNKGSNRTERYIRTMSNIINKSLEGKGHKWPQYVYPACYAMNTQTNAKTGFSPYEMVFLRKPPNLNNFNFDPDKTGIQVDAKTYMNELREKFENVKKVILEKKAIDKQTQWIRDMRKYPDSDGFKVGDLVFLNHDYGSKQKVNAKKFKQKWIGPLKIQSVLDQTHYLIADLNGKIVPIMSHLNRIKPFVLNLGKIGKNGLETASNVKQLAEKWEELKEEIKAEILKTQQEIQSLSKENEKQKSL